MRTLPPQGLGGAIEAAQAGALVLAHHVGWSVMPGCYDPPSDVVDVGGREVAISDQWPGVRLLQWRERCEGVPSEPSWLTYSCEPPGDDPGTARGPLSVMLAGPRARWPRERLVELAHQLEEYRDRPP